MNTFVDLPIDEATQRGLVNRSVALEGRDHRRAASSQRTRAHTAPLSFVRTSSRVNTPRFPISHSAASSAPAANTRRSRTTCSTRICSKGASKITSWLPGTLPTRTLVIGILRPRAASLRWPARWPCRMARSLRGVMSSTIWWINVRNFPQRRAASSTMCRRDERAQREVRRPEQQLRRCSPRPSPPAAGRTSRGVPTTIGVPRRARRECFTIAAPGAVNDGGRQHGKGRQAPLCRAR